MCPRHLPATPQAKRKKTYAGIRTNALHIQKVMCESGLPLVSGSFQDSASIAFNSLSSAIRNASYLTDLLYSIVTQSAFQ